MNQSTSFSRRQSSLIISFTVLSLFSKAMQTVLVVNELFLSNFAKRAVVPGWPAFEIKSCSRLKSYQ